MRQDGKQLNNPNTTSISKGPDNVNMNIFVFDQTSREHRTEHNYLYDHPAGDKEVGGGERRPEEGSHHEEKNNGENTTSDRFEIKSVNGIKCFCSGNLCQWACVCMCIYVRMVIVSSRYCFPNAPR